MKRVMARVARAMAMATRVADILLYCSLLVPCTTLVPLSLSFNSVPEKFKSYLGIQYGIFLLTKKKIVLLYVCRVVSISSIFRKKLGMLGEIFAFNFWLSDYHTQDFLFLCITLTYLAV